MNENRLSPCAMLRILREKYGISQEELASLFGVTTVTIKNWTDGRFVPKKIIREKLQSILKRKERGI